ncbi:hypothetical protein O6H91_11G010600 [Diphasiastrum complanatum]|uniref:Uncharacterized protein n=1 Tax=Diphasiastrum complanatum TaxID=34168 RepID=A0ACC2C6C7_DIPCM|nr:hypothetical protein O6H91_11G010600 [Diphasiastrum complanatum]
MKMKLQLPRYTHPFSSCVKNMKSVILLNNIGLTHLANPLFQPYQQPILSLTIPTTNLLTIFFLSPFHVHSPTQHTKQNPFLILLLDPFTSTYSLIPSPTSSYSLIPSADMKFF